MAPAGSDGASFLRPVEARRGFEEILGQFEEAITAGHLSAGDRLPSERELAARFEVARTSVREALRVLEALGIVRVRRGSDKGATFLERPGNAFPHILRLLLALEHISVRDVIEARIMIESWSAAVVAKKNPADVLQHLEELVRTMEGGMLEASEFHECDVQFHAEIVRAGGNELASLIHEGAQSAIRRIMARSLYVADTEEWPELRRELADDHRAIFEAIAAGEREAAGKAMSEHIRYWGRRATEVGNAA